MASAVSLPALAGNWAAEQTGVHLENAVESTDVLQLLTIFADGHTVSNAPDLF